jgi:hypothetical protein
MQWQRTRFASGTIKMPKALLVFMPRPSRQHVSAIHHASSDYGTDTGVGHVVAGVARSLDQLDTAALLLKMEGG